MNKCLACDNTAKIKYCSNRCQLEYQFQQFVERWKNSEVSGGRGIVAKNFSGHLIRYLREKYDHCAMCGWNEIHPITGRVPLEIDHIDGNAENNSESNLRLICPNCHSLTSNYRNLNYGQGRKWRREKYIKANGHTPL